MDVIVEFVGGPRDGDVRASDSDPEFAAMADRLVSSADDAARKEEKPESLLTWRIPSSQLERQAKAESWPEAKVKALMRYHRYEFTEHKVADGLVMFRAHYYGVA